MYRIISFLFWQWLHYAKQTSYSLDPSNLEQTPNVVIYDLQYRAYNEKGVLLHFLETPKMSHIAKNNAHILNTPHVIVTEPNKDPLEMRADLGTAINKTEKIMLEHHGAD